ncbi:hypothetical protein BV898_12870 [Hypsibius exemplaris]|uniref:Secreted protein n=1 Tax=Hypsibius exemplaris TaxID=2072580 RepID=A0A1W0WCB3_HYPEX|nr:hypothetical protein BV898_12870 [Hypsibius exemplaris]
MVPWFASGSMMANLASILLFSVALVQLARANSSGATGTERVKFFCTFTTDLSYTCKTDCQEGTVPRSQFPDDPNKKYSDMNCSTNVPTGGTKWAKQDGIINRDFDRAGKSVILATCAFYQDNSYECHGVADCGRGQAQGITHCAGGAPWRGDFEGTPQTGFRGKITAQAIHSPIMPG